jgi:LDH2 family malate/lactate/ureidoglycolate dehydrogenase
LALKDAVNARGVLAGVHAAGLTAIAAVLEPLAAGAVAALGEPKLVRVGRELAVLRRNRGLGNVRSAAGSVAVGLVVALSVGVRALLLLHTFNLPHHLRLVVVRRASVELL